MYTKSTRAQNHWAFCIFLTGVFYIRRCAVFFYITTYTHTHIYRLHSIAVYYWYYVNRNAARTALDERLTADADNRTTSTVLFVKSTIFGERNIYPNGNTAGYFLIIKKKKKGRTNAGGPVVKDEHSSMRVCVLLRSLDIVQRVTRGRIKSRSNGRRVSVCQSPRRAGRRIRTAVTRKR